MIDNILKFGQLLFGDCTERNSQWQELAEQFYPQRATFTGYRTRETELGTDLATSFPVLARRELGNSIGALLRPTAKSWFHIRTTEDFDALTLADKRWLEQAENIQRGYMYRRQSNMTRALKEADHDFVTFGNAVIQLSRDGDSQGVFYRCWHPRDVVWAEDEKGEVNTVYRKQMIPIRNLMRFFPKTVPKAISDRADNSPFTTVEIWHAVLPSYMAGDEFSRFAFVSYYISPETNTILESVGQHTLGYVVPRWHMLSGSQYAISQATATALPDARQAQGMARTLLDAGEKAVNPPMVASREVFGGNFALYAGGVTWADHTDGRLGDNFDTLTMDKNGIPFGENMLASINNTISLAFFRDKLTLPPSEREMTAFEVARRMEEYVRNVLPLFEPIEEGYNATLCDLTFETLLRSGAFGPTDTIPPGLRGRELGFTFESPLHDAIERIKVQHFNQLATLTQTAASMSPDAMYQMDMTKAFRSAAEASGMPLSWLRDEDEARRMADQERAMQMAAQAAATPEGQI